MGNKQSYLSDILSLPFSSKLDEEGDDRYDWAGLLVCCEPPGDNDYLEWIVNGKSYRLHLSTVWSASDKQDSISHEKELSPHQVRMIEIMKKKIPNYYETNSHNMTSGKPYTFIQLYASAEKDCGYSVQLMWVGDGDKLLIERKDEPITQTDEDEQVWVGDGDELIIAGKDEPLSLEEAASWLAPFVEEYGKECLYPV